MFTGVGYLQVATHRGKKTRPLGCRVCDGVFFFLVSLFFSFSLPFDGNLAIRKGREEGNIRQERKVLGEVIDAGFVIWDSIVHVPGMICQPD